MLTLSSIDNFAPKNLRQKRWTEMQKHLQENTLFISSQAPIRRSTPAKNLKRKNLVLKKLYTEEIIPVSAVPNEESKKELFVDNLRPNLGAKYFNLTFDH